MNWKSSSPNVAAELQYTLHEKTVRFERLVRERHRRLRRGLASYVLGARPLIMLSAPFIYAMIIPIILVDVMFTLYQSICFPVYGIQRVKRSDFLHFDRQHLQYLILLEKINREYCAYGNGIIAYAREIAACTEPYWCPIKHAQRLRAVHVHYQNFVAYGDAEAYQTKLQAFISASDAHLHCAWESKT